MATELVVRLRASGNQDVEAALAKIGDAATAAGVKMQPLATVTGRLSEQSRFAIRAIGDLAQTLAGTSALLSIIGRENKALQDALEKVTVALSLVSVGMNIFRNITQLSVVQLAAFRAALAAALGPVGIAAAAIIAVASLAAGLAVLVRRHLEAKEAAEKHAHAIEQAGGATAAFERSVAASVETAKIAGFVYSQLTSSVEHFTRLVRESAGAIQGLALETKSLLGADLPSFRDLGQEAKDAAEATKRLREEFERLQEVENATNDLLLADAAMRQAEDGSKRLAEGLRGVALEARDASRILRELAEDAGPLVATANEQAVQAIEDHMQAQRQLAVEIGAATKTLQQESDALIALANTQAVEAIEAHMQTQRQMAATADASKRAAESAKSAWVSGIDNILTKMGVLRETSGNIWDAIKNAAIRALAQIVASKIWDAIAARLKGIGGAGRGLISGALSLIPGIGPILGGIASIFGLQHGGIVTRPTLAMIGEAGPEAVMPLRGSTFAAASIGGGTLNITFTGPVMGNDMQAREFARQMMRHIRQESGRR